MQVIPRVAAPFFFAVSGYYCTAKLKQGRFHLWSYVRRLLIPYFLWTMIYFAYDLLVYGMPSIPERIVSFFIYGSIYHFWFFPALILAVCVFVLLYRIEKLIVPLGTILVLTGCLGHGYYQIGVKLPLLKLLYGMENWVWFCNVFFLGLPSFFLGYLVNRTQERWINPRHITVLLVLIILLFLAEPVILKLLGLSRSVTETLSLFPVVYFLLVWLLRHPMPERSTLSKRCRVLANVTYYSHVLFVMIFNELNALLFNDMLTPTVNFLFTLGMSLILGLVLGRFRNSMVKALVA